MLLNDLYSIEKWSASDTAAGEVHATLLLNPAHPIFAAHFPGQPVLPGACQVQIVEELLSHVFEMEYRLSGAGRIKFLTPIDPRLNPRIKTVLRYAAARAEAAGSGPISAESGRSDLLPVESTQPGPVSGETRSGMVPAELQVTAILSADDATFLKFNGTFRAE